jgi:hypothetical protein
MVARTEPTEYSEVKNPGFLEKPGFFCYGMVTQAEAKRWVWLSSQTSTG